MSSDMIPVPRMDEALPSGPVRRHRRRAQKESRAAAMGKRSEDAMEDRKSRRAERVSKEQQKQQQQQQGKNAGVLKGYRVIVSGMQRFTTEEQVRSLFRSVGGKILKCTMGRQAGTNKPVGVAEIVYETSAQADKAARVMNKATVDGRVIAVQARGLAFFTSQPQAPAKKAKAKTPAAAPKSKSKAPKKEPITTASLDASLQSYMSQ